jgi:phosphate transport system protein
MLVSYKKKIKVIEKDIITSLEKIIKANNSMIKEIEKQNATKLDTDKYHLKYISNKKKIKRKIEKIDDNIVATIALHSPEAKDLKILVSYLKVSDSIFKVSSNIRMLIKYISSESKEININHINKYILPANKLNIKSLENIISIISSDNIEDMTSFYKKILVFEDKINELQKTTEKTLINMVNNKSTFKEYYEIINFLRKNKSTSDKIMSITSFLMYPYSNL